MIYANPSSEHLLYIDTEYGIDSYKTYFRTHFSEQKGEFLIAYSWHPSILHNVVDCNYTIINYTQ